MSKKRGSIQSRIVDSFLKELGVSREQVDKMTQLWETVDVQKNDDGIVINIKLKNIQVKIETDN